MIYAKDFSIMEKSLSVNNDSAKHRAALSLLKTSLERGEIFDFEIKSGSMAPLMERGDRVSVRRSMIDGLRKGDIIVYSQGEHLYAHRYVGRRGMGNQELLLITKGDSMPLFDDVPIPIDLLIGKIIHIKKAGKIIDMDKPVWVAVNYILANISILQGRILLCLGGLRRYFLKNRECYPGLIVRELVAFFFFIPLKLIARLGILLL